MNGILLVEHSRRFLCTFGNQLTGNGFKVFRAFDCDTTGETLKDHGADVNLVVMDLLFKHDKPDDPDYHDSLNIMPCDILDVIARQIGDLPVIGLTNRTEKYATRQSLQQSYAGVVYVARKTNAHRLAVVSGALTWLSATCLAGTRSTPLQLQALTAHMDATFGPSM